LFHTDGKEEKGCWKTVLRSQHTAAGRVGRRVAPESAAAAFSDRNDGQQSFSAAY